MLYFSPGLHLFFNQSLSCKSCTWPSPPKQGGGGGGGVLQDECEGEVKTPFCGFEIHD